MLSQEVLRKRRAFVVITLSVRLGRIARVVWREEGHIKEKGFVRISLFNETHRLVGKLGAGKSLRLASVTQFPLTVILHLEVTMIIHATHIDRTPF